MRRRRRFKPLWFPPLGARDSVVDEQHFTGGTTFQLAVRANAEPEFRFLPVTFDQGQENILQQSAAGNVVTLADLMASSWRLRRMVGNVFASYQLTGVGGDDIAPGQAHGCVFAMGAIVLAQDASGGPGNATDFPSPLNRDDYTDPWIWRRLWVLGTGQTPLRSAGTAVTGFSPIPGIVPDENRVFANFPNNNALYGSMREGTYIDQKTNRVIGPEERLFLIFATHRLPLTEVSAVDSFVTGYFDFRYLGGLQRSSNRRNASR